MGWFPKIRGALVWGPYIRIRVYWGHTGVPLFRETIIYWVHGESNGQEHAKLHGNFDAVATAS